MLGAPRGPQTIQVAWQVSARVKSTPLAQYGHHGVHIRLVSEHHLALPISQVAHGLVHQIGALRAKVVLLDKTRMRIVPYAQEKWSLKAIAGCLEIV